MIKSIDKYLAKAKKYFESGEFNKSLKELGKITFLEPEHEKANYYKGLIYAKKGKINDAILSLKIVSSKAEDFFIRNQVNLLLGYLYYKIKKYKNAIFYFQKILDSGLNSSPTYNALATCYYEIGETAKAISLAQKALDTKKDNYNAMNTLGYILVDSETDIDKGIEYIKKALQQDPDNPARLDSMGWAYYKKGDYNLAQTFLRKAYTIAPKEKEIMEHLRKVLSKIKD